MIDRGTRGWFLRTLWGSITRGARAVRVLGLAHQEITAIIQSQSGGVVMPQEPTRYHLQLLSQ